MHQAMIISHSRSLHPYNLPTEEQPAPLRVALVEDVTADALLTQRALKHTGIPVDTVRLHNGEALLQHLSDRRQPLPQVILLDLGLPGVTGFEILEQLVSMPPALRAIPIVVLTGYDDFEYLAQSYPLSIIAYVRKPCSAEALRHVLQRLPAENRSLN